MAKENFEKAMERLKEIVQQLEAGDISLEESLKKFEEGIKLSQLCLRKLDEADRQIETLVKGEGGRLAGKPFESEGNA